MGAEVVHSLRCLKKLWLGPVLILALTGFVVGSDPRIVVMGDLHGDLPRLTKLLQLTHLADPEGEWEGGGTILILTGDLLDRGPSVRQVLDLVMGLEKAAPKSGGKVITLFGNHEMMNILGDLRYVAPQTYTAFVDEDSEKRRKEAYEKYLQIQRRQAGDLGQPEPVDTPEVQEQWKAERPLGFVEYREALSRKGKYGRWLRQLPAVVKIGDTIFLHGGIHPGLAKFELEELNERIRKEVESYDFVNDYLSREGVFAPFYTFSEMRAAVGMRLSYLTGEAEGAVTSGVGNLSPSTAGSRLSERDQIEVDLLNSFLNMGGWLSVHPDGPLWFRGYGHWTEEEGTGQVAEILKRYGAKYFVVGHTISADREIVRRLGGQVFLVDTTLPSALEIQGGQFTAIYPDGREEPKMAESTKFSETVASPSVRH